MLLKIAYHEQFHDAAALYIQVQPEFCPHQALNTCNVVHYNMQWYIPCALAQNSAFINVFHAFQEHFTEVLLSWIEAFPDQMGFDPKLVSLVS